MPEKDVDSVSVRFTSGLLRMSAIVGLTTVAVSTGGTVSPWCDFTRAVDVDGTVVAGYGGCNTVLAGDCVDRGTCGRAAACLWCCASRMSTAEVPAAREEANKPDIR